MRYTRQDILNMMRERILILDGATGTYLQQLQLSEEDFRGITNSAFNKTEQGQKFADHPTPLKGCNDVLCLTQPEKIIAMHKAYIDAGADIIETNSFNCNRFSLADYGLEDKVYEISKAAAQCALQAGERQKAKDERDIIIAGSMGPTNRTCSMSGDVNNPASRDVTFQELVDTYKDAVKGLWDGGVDVILVETIFDTLNAKAALKAISEVEEEREVDIPTMASGTLSDASGRTLSGQTVEAYYASLAHGNLLSIGLNCGFGAKQLLPWLTRLSEIAHLTGSGQAKCPVSVHPNAGLPNVMGGYDETPETFAEAAKSYMRDGLVNIYGGCCGTTPEHIRKVAELAKGYKPRKLKDESLELRELPYSTLSGLEPLRLDKNTGFVNVGERTNVAGSAKFKKLIQAGNYEEALSVARAQVDAGAQVIDICMDDGLIDGVKAMTTFLNLIASEPEIARVPVMIDSSKWEIIKAGLQCVQGKSIVNSISLKEGEEKFIEKAKYIHSMGAATVVMLFDEKGQADTYERKMEVARRAYKLLRDIDFPTEDIIFDPNVLAVATGMPEHDDYARAFIEACRTIHEEMPEVHMSGGISNLSFSFRGNNTIRQAMHSVFLYHAIKAGLDMSIVNPAMLQVYSEIPEDMLKVVEDVILNKDKEASERLINFAQKVKEDEEARKSQTAELSGTVTGRTGTVTGKTGTITGRTPSLKERISFAMLKGITDQIEADTLEAYKEAGSALGVIDAYLMPAMEEVGRLFGDGKMFLPQVVKSARVMKKAVAILEPYIIHNSQCKIHNPALGGVDGYLPKDEGRGRSTFRPSSKVLMATVKGDVHDIGKNIVSVVTQCNGYEVKDLGVMVDCDTIVETAREWKADVIGLSGLITPSLDEMIRVIRKLQSLSMNIPVIVGGATTSALHTAVKMAPEYPNGVVVHSNSAAEHAALIRKLIGEDREEFIAELKSQQKIVRDNFSRREVDKSLLTIEESRQRRFIKPQELIAVPKSTEQVIFHTKISEISDRINWQFFFNAWGLKGESRDSEEGRKLKNDALQMLREIEEQNLITLQGTARILPAYSTDKDEIVITCGNKDFTLPFPRSLKDEPQTNCLADHIAQVVLPSRTKQNIYSSNRIKENINSGCPCCQNSLPKGEGRGDTDFICPFVVTAGVGLKALQEHYRKDNDEYKAIMAKLLCDRLAEAFAEYVQEYMQKHFCWGNTAIRMAFGYGACPDHALKIPVLEMLKTKDFMDISLTETNMINPGESICGLIFANTPTKYFKAP